MRSSHLKSFTVGLTGGIGSGKSTVADLFAARGIALIDTDLLSREVVERGQPALAGIADRFGADIITPDGDLDREKLRNIIFASETEKQWLEALLHPLISALLRTRIEEAQSAYSILVSPLLLETDQHRLVDRILVVDVPQEIQLKRTMARDPSSEETIRAIIAAQISRDDRLERADDIVDNSADAGELDAQVEALHKRYLAMSRDFSKE